MKKASISLLLLGVVLIASPFAFGSEGAGHPETYLGIPAGILKFVNVVVFVFALAWVLKTPISNAFKARGEKIKADLDEARLRQEKADSLAVDIQARLDSIEKEVASIIERAKEDGEKQKNEIIDSAKAEAEKILASARGEVEARVKVARKELTEFAGQLAAEKAHEMLASSMNESDRRKVFAESVDNLVETES